MLLANSFMLDSLMRFPHTEFQKSKMTITAKKPKTQEKMYSVGMPLFIRNTTLPCNFNTTKKMLKAIAMRE